MNWLSISVAAAALLASACAFAEEEERAATLEEAIAEKQYRNIEGVIVRQGGETLYEAYFGDANAQTRIDARSAGKSITAIAVGRAIADGHLSGVDAPIFPFFDDMEPIANDGPKKRAITVRDLLTMSSALDCNDWDMKNVGNEERMYETEIWTRFALDIPVMDGYERKGDGLGRYSYCTAGAFLLGRVVERAAGVPFDKYVERILFEPLGIKDPQWKRSPTGEVQSGGQLSLRARDFAAIAEVTLNWGRNGGDEIVPQDWVKEMISPVRMATPDDGYAYLWWVRPFHLDGEEYLAAYMSGNGGNKVIVLPHLDAVIVVLSTNYNRRNMHQQTTDIVERYLMPMLSADVEPSLPHSTGKKSTK